MRIFIPTYGRHTKQQTFLSLPIKLQKLTTLVVQARERHLYDGGFPDCLVLPDNIRTIAPTRQFIADVVMGKEGKFVMLDDDLLFYKRREDEPEKFVPADNLTQMFKQLERQLDTYVHAGVLAREGGNRVTSEFKVCTRMTRILAYRADILWRESVTFNRLQVQEDFDVTLQLLRKGYKNVVLCDWVHNQRASGDKGGCSHFRTIELHNNNVKKLASLHPEFVNIVQKQTKNAWGGQARLDVNVQWKKAYQSSQI